MSYYVIREEFSGRMAVTMDEQPPESESEDFLLGGPYGSYAEAFAAMKRIRVVRTWVFVCVGLIGFAVMGWMFGLLK